MRELPYIIMNGKSSLDFDMIIANQSKYDSPENDMEQIEVMGRDGVLLVDNDRLKPVKRSLPFSIKIPYDRKIDISLRETEISEWLSAKGWQNLFMSWDPDYNYRVAIIEGFELTETVKWFGKGIIELLVHPIKYLKSGQITIDIANGTSIYNPTKRPSEPTYFLTGTGNVTVTINNKQMIFKNITNGITVDVEQKTVTYINQSHYDKMYSDFVLLEPGQNKITWDNTNFKLKIFPNWGVRL